VPSILILAEVSEPIVELCSGLTRKGYDCSISPVGEDEKAPDLVLVETDSFKMKTLSQGIKRDINLPIIALVHREMLDVVNTHLGIDDFVIQPYDLIELELRIKRLLHKTRSVDSSELSNRPDQI